MKCHLWWSKVLNALSETSGYALKACRDPWSGWGRPTTFTYNFKKKVVISLVMVVELSAPPPKKKMWNLYESFTVREDHINTVVSETLQYTETDRHPSTFLSWLTNKCHCTITCKNKTILEQVVEKQIFFVLILLSSWLSHYHH